MATTRVMEIRWNGVLVGTRDLVKSVRETLKRVETAVENGVADGATTALNRGKVAAKQVILKHDAIGPNRVLFNSIRSDVQNKKNFYLIAGYGETGEDRYPLLIEQGFPKQWKSSDDPRFREWLQYRGLLINKKTGAEIAGMWIGKNRKKWETGIRFMETAYNEIGSNLNKLIVNAMIERIRKSAFK